MKDATFLITQQQQKKVLKVQVPISEWKAILSLSFNVSLGL